MAEEFRALLDENRRIRREVRLLHERVAAFERSRWWRLHPRRLLRRAGTTAGETDSARVPEAQVDAAGRTDVRARFMAEVASRGTFEKDVFTHEIERLDPLVRSLTDRDAEILEIGSYEGLSSCYFLWRLPRSHLTCVDTFRGTLGSVYPSPDLLEARFDANVALVEASRVRKLVGDSRRVLLDLLEEDARFDLVYVDGSHFSLDVLVDGALAWRLLAPGGTMVFDDYAWNDKGEDPLLRPGPAIDALLRVLEGKHELLEVGAQLAVRKTA